MASKDTDKPQISRFEGFDFFLSQIRPSLKELTAFAFFELLNRYQAIIDQAQGHLIAAARQLQNENDKARFIAAIEQCQRMKGGMTSAFGHGLMEAFKPLNGHPAEAQPQTAFQGSVSALASHAREDETFLLAAATRALKQYEPLTNNIADALAKSLPGANINRANNPFNPMILCNALFGSLKITSMHSSAKKEILALFDSQLLKQLEAFYIALLQHLQEAGLKVKIPNAQASQAPDEEIVPLLEPEPAQLDTIESGFNTLLEDGVIPPDFNTLHYTPLEYQYASDPARKIVVIPEKSIDELLASLQKGYDPATDGSLPAYLKSHLIIEAKSGETNVISKQHENIINLVSLLFDQVAESQDRQLADLFLRLKVAYTRLALTDGLFFHDSTHPARLLLDELLALTYSTHDVDTLRKQMQTAVMKVLLRYSGEISLFVDLVKAVQGYRDSNSKPFAESTEKLRQQLEHEEQQRHARDVVNGIISQRSQRLTRKLRFHVLTERLFGDMLARILLEQGNEAKTFQLGTKLLEAVFILTDRNDSQHFHTLAKDMPTVIRKLSQYLMDNGIDASRKNVFLEQLQEIQTLLAQGKKPSDLDDDELSHTFDVDMIIDDYDSERVADMDTALIGHEHRKFANASQLELVPELRRPSQASTVGYVKNLQLGQWMNFVIDKESMPCTPGYFSKQKDSYIFCDRHNRKLFERKRAEIVQDITSGFACPLASILSFEGNLARVVNRLNNPG